VVLSRTSDAVILLVAAFAICFLVFAFHVDYNDFPVTDSNMHSITGFVTHSIYPSFSAAESGFVFNNNTRLLSVADDAVYKTGYYSINGSAWISFSLTGAAYGSSTVWLTSTATKTLPSFGVGEHYIIIYSCKYSNNWNCSDNRWQLIVINNTPSPIVSPFPNCSDGIKNQEETDVDCGGPCSICAVKNIFYGSPYGSDCVGNLQVGDTPHRQVDFRFKAEHTGLVTGVNLYLMYSSGYGAGNGGILKISLETDDGTPSHLPSGTVLTSVIDSNPMGHGGNGGDFYYDFDSSAQLTEGTIYHLHFTNLDSDSVNNFVSMNSLYSDSGRSALNPTDFGELATFYKDAGGNWVDYNVYIPIYALYYGTLRYGQGYRGCGITSYTKTISGNSKVRSNFVVIGEDVTVTQVHIRLSKLSGTGNLTVRLEYSNGTLIEQGEILASSIGSDMTWVGYKFLSTHKLTAGSNYHLVLSTASSTTYHTYYIEDGGQYEGYALMFPDGHMEYTTDGSMWNNVRQLNDRLQGYFDIA
jgi:hypothetical protein